MIKCEKGTVEIKGKSMELVVETVGILKALIEDGVIEPMGVMAIATTVLEDAGFKVVHGTEEDLKNFIEQELNDGLDIEDDSDDSDDDDFDENDIFKFLRGDK